MERATIPAAAARMIQETGICYVATVRPDGTPNLSPKGTLKVRSENQLAFADIASPNTRLALAHNPGIDINVVDPFARRGFRFRGKASVSDASDLIDWLLEELAESYPVESAVIVEVHEVLPLFSPIYTIHGATEDKVRSRWERNLGYRRMSTSS